MESDNYVANQLPSTISWREILWREKQTCADRDYVSHLRRVLVAEPTDWLYYFKVRQQIRSSIGDVEATLRVACHRRWSIKYLWAKRLTRLG